MRYQAIPRQQQACREQGHDERSADMISHTPHFAFPGVGPGCEQPRASADGLLSLAAAPTFAIMALLGGMQEDGLLCSSAHEASALTGMVAMYVLMSAFHSAPWLRLIASRLRRRRPVLARHSPADDSKRAVFWAGMT